MNTVLKNKLDRELSSSVITVIFTKVDGSRREMSCTQSLDYIPVGDHPQNISNAGDVRNVFDVSLQEWRSFRVDNVISWTDSKGATHKA